MSNHRLSDLQLFGVTTFLALLASPGIAALSFFIKLPVPW